MHYIIVASPVDVLIDVPEELDISHLRGCGLQAGEVELPEGDAQEQPQQEGNIPIVSQGACITTYDITRSGGAGRGCGDAAGLHGVRRGGLQEGRVPHPQSRLAAASTEGRGGGGEGLVL